MPEERPRVNYTSRRRDVCQRSRSRHRYVVGQEIAARFCKKVKSRNVPVIRAALSLRLSLCVQPPLFHALSLSFSLSVPLFGQGHASSAQNRCALEERGRSRRKRVAGPTQTAAPSSTEIFGGLENSNSVVLYGVCSSPSPPLCLYVFFFFFLLRLLLLLFLLFLLLFFFLFFFFLVRAPLAASNRPVTRSVSRACARARFTNSHFYIPRAHRRLSLCATAFRSSLTRSPAACISGCSQHHSRRDYHVDIATIPP